MPFTQYFRLVDVQARLALKADASKYHLGYLWWILEPLLFVIMFYIVFKVILDSRTENFLVFLMCGKLPFLWFSKSVSNAANAILGGAGLIGRIDISKSLFPLAKIQESLYRQLPVFLLLFLVLMFYGFYPSLTWIWLAPLLILNYLMIVSCGLLGATIVCYARDFSLLITLGMIFLMFTSGIFWDVRTIADSQLRELILLVNPMAFLLDGYRQVLMYRQAPDLSGYFLNLVIFSSLLVTVLYVMQKNSRVLALRALTS